ncbi:hypothetical protein K503DRAFT_868561 [Rhizopogon vinicolor AM-OR11-026]|uniref:Uncharacterized protein n=1 Tax=Rhizopogon vinicolor AM-OR11-026 TaxID=1314800 RepID=A0A1B7MQU4_9AGAM|nr:hypothetical protein K503DRAFT_868561 [Rhizopogon vinicolor AM-OR11-026]
MTPQAGGYIRRVISWMRLIVRVAARRSCTTLLYILRLFCQVLKDPDGVFREPGLALSSQPIDQNRLTLTLAVPSISSVDTSPPESATSGQSSDIVLYPIIPAEVKRYDRNVSVQRRNHFLVFRVSKGPLDCSDELAPVAGWEQLIQPEGALIFYHPYKRVFTEANVRSPEIATKIGKAVEKAYEEVRRAEISLHPSVELVLELMDNGSWGYYFADHDRRVVFWFEDHMSFALMSYIRGVERKSHVIYALETQYWKHIELFPNKRYLPEDVVLKLKEFVIYAHAESITSETSLAPFSPDEVARMLDLMDLLMSSVNKGHEHSVWIVARFMGSFYHAKFANFCGQPGARLDSDQWLYDNPSSRSKGILLRAINIILLGSPDAYIKALHRVWVDGSPIQQPWEHFMDKLNTDWNGYFGFFSTVMLAVNISFLALPSVNLGSDQTQTAATLATYLSTLCAMGSLVVTIILSGQGSQIGSSAMGGEFVVVGMSAGLDSLAHMLSLPFALLIWAIIFFAVAFSVVIFDTSDVITLSIVSPIWATIVVIVMWRALGRSNLYLRAMIAYGFNRLIRTRLLNYIFHQRPSASFV